MTAEIPNVTITSGSTVLAGSTVSTFGTLEIDGSMNTPATGQIWQESGANIQRFNDRVYVGGATVSDVTAGAQSWLDALLGIGPSSAQLCVLSQSTNTAVEAGVQSSTPGGQFITDAYAAALFGINNDRYTPSAVQWQQARLNGFDGLHSVVLNNGNLYTLSASGNSWSSPNGPSIADWYVGDGTVAWAHANAITWQPSSKYGPYGTTPGTSVPDGTVVWTPGAPVAWQPSHPYLQYSVVTNGGNYYVCKTAGTSASSGGPSGTGTSITDGSVVWTYEAPAAWQQSHAYGLYNLVSNDTPANYYVCVLAGTSATVVVSNAGNYYVCTRGGTSASSGGPTGTGSSITDGTAQWSYQSSMSSSTTWAQSHAYSLYAPVVNGTSYYVCIHAGTSAGPAGPIGTGSGIADGGVVWSYQTPAAWLPSHAYASDSVVTNGGNYYVCKTAGTSASSGGPTGTGTSVTDGSVVWTYEAPTAWQASQAYVAYNLVSNGSNYYVCVTAGTSAGPFGPTGTGSGISDGNAVWSYLRANSIPPAWQPSHSYNPNDIVYSPSRGGMTYLCVQGGTSAATAPSGSYVWNDGGVQWLHEQAYPYNAVTTLYVESRHSSSAMNTYTLNSEMDIVVLAWAWQPSHAYNLNDVVTNGGNTYLCMGAGTSASSGGPTGSGSSISDGTATWAFNPGASAWLPSTAHALNVKVYNGTNVYVCVQAGTSAASGGPVGTGSAIADGSVIWSYQPSSTPIGYIDPCLMYEQAKTIGLWLSSGRPDVASADATVALGIINNAGTAYASSGRYSKGIVIDADAIVGTTAFSPGASCAIALASGHHIQWFAPIQGATQGYWQPNTAYSLGYYAYNSGYTYICTQAGTSAASGGPSGTSGTIADGTAVWAYFQGGPVGGEVVAAIACNATVTGQPSLGLTNGYAAFTEGDGGAWLFDIVGVANPLARIEATAAASGATPSLAAVTWAGTESIDLALKAQQGGYLQLFTPSASATNAASFSATHRLAVKDSSGTVYYLACSSTAW